MQTPPTNKTKYAHTRKATPTPPLTQETDLSNSKATNKNHNSAKNTWKSATAPMKNDANSHTDSMNSEKTTNITQSIKPNNVEVLKTTTSASTETAATSST
jgi:hypothetical protein